ncbi:hypothetical protein FQA39_LY07893 [Lamprigera yunnana]|nr:hypothetical protein FQA39_LY07893 [Lamprigera yunnana]
MAVRFLLKIHNNAGKIMATIYIIISLVNVTGSDERIDLKPASTRRNIKRQRLNVELGKSVTAANNDEDSSDSDVPTRNLTNDDSDDDHTVAAVEETQEESEYITPQIEQIVVGKFVLVKVKGDSRKKITYVQKGDEFLADEFDIIAILPHPQAATVHGELTYSFQKDIDIFESI